LGAHAWRKPSSWRFCPAGRKAGRQFTSRGQAERLLRLEGKPSFPMGCAGRLPIRKFTRRRPRWRSTKEENHNATGLLTQPAALP